MKRFADKPPACSACASRWTWLAWKARKKGAAGYYYLCSACEAEEDRLKAFDRETKARLRVVEEAEFEGIESDEDPGFVEEPEEREFNPRRFNSRRRNPQDEELRRRLRVVNEFLYDEAAWEKLIAGAHREGLWVNVIAPSKTDDGSRVFCWDGDCGLRECHRCFPMDGCERHEECRLQASPRAFDVRLRDGVFGFREHSRNGPHSTADWRLFFETFPQGSVVTVGSPFGG